MFYGAKLYEEQLGKGEDYHQLTRVVTINLMDFSFFTSDQYRSCYRLMEENSYETYPDLMQLHFIEMPKFVQQEQKKAIDVYDRMAKWLRFLTNEEDSRWEEMAERDPIIEKAVDILRAASLDPQTRMQYEAREKALKDITSIRGDGLREGIEQGIELGKTAEKVTMVKRMLLKGVDIDTIVEFTGLSLLEIIKVKDQMTN